MSNLNQFFGGGGTPIGGLVLMPDAAANPTLDGKEYLRTGSIKTYASDYAAAVAAAPQLRVFGIDATSLKNTAGSSKCTYNYIGTKYVVQVVGGGQYYSSDLITWTGCTGSFTSSSAHLRAANNGSSYMVVPAAANTAHKYTSDGITFTAVGGGGTFTTHPQSRALVYGNSWWVALSDIANTAGGLSYINNANPSGTWTIATSPNLSGTSAGINALAFGGSGNWFVAVGGSASATAGKIAYCTTPSGTWTNATVSSGITWPAAGTVVKDIVFDGTYFVLIDGYNNVWRASDPTGAWTSMGVLPLDTSTENYTGSYTSGFVNSFVQFATNGAGTICASVGCSTFGKRYLMLISTDGATTWNPAQVYAKSTQSTTSTASTISFANSKWIANYAGSYNCNIDMGPLTTANYVGQQYQNAFGFYVRIK